MRRSVSFSTELVEPGLRDEVWREVSRPLFEVSPADGRAALRGRFVSQPLESLTIGATAFNRQRYRRDQRTIVRGDFDHYLLQVLTAGSLRGDCDGVDLVAGPGDICFFDLARPYATDAEAGARVTLLVPRRAIEAAARGRSLHGQVLRAADPLARLLRNLLFDLQQISSELSEADLPAAEAAVLETLAAVLARRAADGSPGRAAPGRQLRRRILAFIDLRLSDSALGVELLMREFQLSRAHLYRVFASDGGVASIIRERRLDAAFHRLRQIAGRERSIGDIAFEFGFPNSSQFARAFRSRFAISPTRVRMDLAVEGPGGATLQSHLIRQTAPWVAADGAA